MPHIEKFARRTMHNPAAFIGKHINPTKWVIPSGYEICRMTGKFHRLEDLEVTFAHWKFERDFLRTHHIMVEDADWLSEEGYDRIVAKLESLNLYNYYINYEVH